jgi:glycosyltransferase involved in cell wall biosynthesis
MEKHPKVFIVILNYNGKDVLKKCLLSVFKNDYPNFEIVLVDNNSIDGSFEMAKADFSKANFIGKQRGYTLRSRKNGRLRAPSE